MVDIASIRIYCTVQYRIRAHDDKGEVSSYPYPLYENTPPVLFVMLRKTLNEPKQIRHFTHRSNDDGENGQGYFILHPTVGVYEQWGRIAGNFFRFWKISTNYRSGRKILHYV